MSDNEGGYLVPDVYIHGGTIMVWVDKPGFGAKIARMIGHLIISAGEFFGIHLYRLGRNIYYKGRTEEPKEIQGLLALREMKINRASNHTR